MRAYKMAKVNKMRFGKASNRFPFYDKMDETLKTEGRSVEVQLH